MQPLKLFLMWFSHCLSDLNIFLEKHAASFMIVLWTCGTPTAEYHYLLQRQERNIPIWPLRHVDSIARPSWALQGRGTSKGRQLWTAHRPKVPKQSHWSILYKPCICPLRMSTRCHSSCKFWQRGCSVAANIGSLHGADVVQRTARAISVLCLWSVSVQRSEEPL